jgi:PAS domain S-box-containing protein
MRSRAVGRLPAHGEQPIYVVGTESGDQSGVCRQLSESDLRYPVEAAPAGSFAEGSAAPAAVVCVDPAGPTTGRNDGGGDVRAVGARSEFRGLIERAAATGGDCPVIVVGADIDAAAAYDAGATDIVPLDFGAHAEVVADRIRSIVERAGDGRLLADVVDRVSDGIVVHDPETGEMLAYNDRFCRILGYDPATADLALADIVEVDGEFTTERAVSLIRQAAAGSPTTVEWKDTTADGDDVWVEVRIEAAELAGTRYVVSSVREIEDRKERERELRRNRAMFQRLHEITSDPELSFRERVRELLGFGAAELGVDIGFLSRIDPEAGDFEIVEAEGDHPLIQAGAESELEETYCRRLVGSAAEAPVAVRDAGSEMAGDPAYEKFGLGCYLGAKIEVDGELYGSLCFADSEPRQEPFSGVEQALIDHVAQQLQGELQQEEYVREIEAAQEQRSRVFDRIDDAFFGLDTEWRIQYANDAGAAVLRGAMNADYTEEELIGRHIWDEIPEAEGTRFYQEYHRAMEGGVSVSFEAEYEPLDVWFDVRAYPDETGLSVYFTDITERKQREQELERYETILESLDDAVYAIEPGGEVTYVNQQYASMKGVDREDIIGTNIYDWIDEETTERAREVRRQLDDEGRPVGTLEYDFQSVDGETTPVEMRFASIGDDPKEGARVGVIRDISDRKERERELYIRQRAIEEAAIPLALSDPTQDDNPMVYVNQAFQELTGYDAEEALGRNCRFLQGPDTDPETVAEIRAAVDADEEIVREIRNYRADGTEFWNRLSITPIYDEDGTLLRYLGSQRDITERYRNRRVRTELLSTTRELMDADSRERIARIVSAAAEHALGHDLNAVYLRADDDTDAPLTPVAWSDRVEREYGGALPTDPDGPLGRAFESGEPVVRDDVASAPDLDPADYAPASSVLALPLGDHGVLALGRLASGAFDDIEIERAELLTVNATAAFDRMDRTEELETYETLFETVRDKLYVADSDGSIEMVSRPLAEAVGRDPEDLRDRHVSEILTEETVTECRTRTLDLLVTPEAVSSACEGALRGEDGDVPVEIELSLLPYDDQFQGVVGAVRDISQRRQREEELRVFRQALTEAGIGLAMYDESGRFGYVNDHYARMLGRSREDVESEPVWQVFEEVTEGTFASYWDSFVLDETRTEQTEHRRDDHSTVPVETVTTAVDVDGTEYHILTIREITRRRERRQQSEVLHRLIRHNLRNDLTVILGHSGMLAADLDGASGDAAGVIRETAEDLQGLTETAQDAQEIIGRETVRKPIDAVRLLRAEIESLRGDTDAAVTVEADLPEAAYVLADAPLQLAFRHLLRNAVEHTDRPDPTVSVRAAPAADRSGWIDVEIADDGPGIPDNEVRTLTAGEETALQHGSGIGLWIIHWVVARYGGELEFETPEGGGSRVRIKLPTTDRTPGADGGGEPADGEST